MRPATPRAVRRSSGRCDRPRRARRGSPPVADAPPRRNRGDVAVRAPQAGIVPPAVADVEAHITGTVWKIEVAVGDQVDDGDTVAILESMKMEMPVEAEDSGTVMEIVVAEGQAVSEGDTLIVLE